MQQLDPLGTSVTTACSFSPADKGMGIRAAVCTETYSAKYTRLHNDANVLCMGARVVGEGLAREILDTFLFTEFEGGRHQRRIDMIAELEK